MDVYSTGAWRCPDAQLDEVDGRLTVVLSSRGEAVLPAGVLFDDDADDSPRKLPLTLHEMFSSLEELAVPRDESARPAIFLKHCQTQACLDLCHHGHGRWHARRPGGCPLAGEAGAVRLDVAHAVKFAEGLQAVAHAVDSVTTGKPVPQWALTNLIKVMTPDSVVRTQLRQLAERHPSSPRSEPDDYLTRHHVRRAVDELMASTGLRPFVRWPHRGRPELGLLAQSTAALYVADLLRHVGTADEDRTFPCAFCERPVTRKRRPKPGERVYCTDQKCRREKNRQATTRHRAGESSRG